MPNLVAVPAGAALVLDGHVGWLSWLAASPVLGLLLVPLLVRSVAPRGGPGPAGTRRAAVRAALTPSLVLFAVTLAGGGLVTFLPIERPDGVLATVALLAFGITGAVTRWRAGTAGRSAGRRLAPAAGPDGRRRRAGADRARPDRWRGWVVAGAAVFGAGFGAAQNLTLVAAFARAGEAGTTTASALWNASFDAGTATGALVLGLVAAGLGLGWTYVLAAALLAAAFPLAVASGHRPQRVR